VRDAAEQIVAILKQAEMGMPVADLFQRAAELIDELRSFWLRHFGSPKSRYQFT
jgi:hypothetical protein